EKKEKKKNKKKKEKKTKKKKKKKNKETTDDAEKEKDKDSDKDKAKDEDKDEEASNDDVKTKSVESDDDNVAEAFTGNWKPIGTEQSGPHTVNYDDGSQDRKEMEEAVTVATGIEDMTVWWLSRAGDQKVEATISNNRDQSEVYRVNIEWVDEKGWKPTKVEMLKENDKK